MDQDPQEPTGVLNKLQYLLCEHIKDSGVRCGAPALSGGRYCRFHFRTCEEKLAPGDPGYLLPVLDNQHSIQVALQQLMAAILAGKISERKGAVMLSAIKAAGQLVREANANAPKEQLCKELATELRGRLVTNSLTKRQPQPAESSSTAVS